MKNYNRKKIRERLLISLAVGGDIEHFSNYWNL